MIRLLIAAGSAVVRAGLESLIGSSPGIELTGSYPDLASAEELRPDVILAALPVSGLPDAGPPVVLLTSEAEPAWTQELVQSGVRAILPRDATAAAILAAVEAAAAGFAVVAPEELHTIVAAPVPVAAAPEPSGLTPRELEVLRMMAEGDANKTIAWKLSLSEHTVKFYVASILAKLAASSRTEAVTIGIRRGLVLL